MNFQCKVLFGIFIDNVIYIEYCQAKADLAVSKNQNNDICENT